MDFSQFEKKISVDFKTKALLRQAFTHRSYINENKGIVSGHNERLEFLGDAVLELIVTDFLYKKFPEATEGDMTSYRSALVNAITLSKVAADLGMENFLLLSKGEAKDKGRARQYILANTYEAVVGAIFVDSGYEVTNTYVAANLFPLLEEILRSGSWIDAKSLFQEKAQDVVGVTPSYTTLKEYGPDHDKHFVVGVHLGSELIAEGEGQSKQDAEQIAAKNALEKKKWQ